MPTVCFDSESSIDKFLNPENWDKFVFDSFYCESPCPDNFRFETDGDGFLTLPFRGINKRIAIIGLNGFKVSFRRISFEAYGSIEENKVYIVTDRTAVFVYRSQKNAIEMFQERLRTLNNPFGKRSFEEINISIGSIQD